MITIKISALCASLLLLATAAAAYVPQIADASQTADFSRLPRFFTSDPDYDEFVNEYFIRHLSVDERGIYRHPISPGTVDHMWEKEWDAWFLPWVDRGAMGLTRQNGDSLDVVLYTLLNSPVDKYGYVFGSLLYPEPNEMLGGYRPTFSWPWPKYQHNTTVSRPTGWEFNGEFKAEMTEWESSDVELSPQYLNYRLVCKITGPHPRLTTPKFDVDVLHVPIIELDIEYKPAAGKDIREPVRGLRLYWTTSDSPEFSEDKSVGLDFCDLPPDDFPEDYARCMGKDYARYPLFFPMYMHPKWGREGRKITRLRVVPTGSDWIGTELHVNYVRASYDVRLSVSNTTLIYTAYRFYLWTGDKQFLTAIMPRLRKATIFLNEHLHGKRDGLPSFDWMVGHDGLAPEVGHGLEGSYWDLLPAGHFDLESSIGYLNATRAMAELETVVKKHGIRVPEVNVLGPGDSTRISYSETPASLRALANRAKKEIELRFWMPNTGRFCRNIDIKGGKHDYGFLHFNLLTLAYGIGTRSQRDSILSWLDGRVIEGDTSTGKDIYHWRFAPRTSTKRNETFYFWPWADAIRTQPDLPQFQWGNQMQDGGAVPFTSLFDLIVRTRTFDQKQIDRAFERTLEVRDWFRDVKKAGGEGTEFYRTYYNGHPERGMQQGGGPPGNLGLDREFLSDASCGTTFVLYAFLGVNTVEDGVLDVAPAIPSRLSRVGVTNVFFRGNYVTIEAGRDYVSFEGSKMPSSAGLKAIVTLRNVPKDAGILVNGWPCERVTRGPGGSATVVIDLKPVRVDVSRRSWISGGRSSR